MSYTDQNYYSVQQRYQLQSEEQVQKIHIYENLDEKDQTTKVKNSNQYDQNAFKNQGQSLNTNKFHISDRSCQGNIDNFTYLDQINDIENEKLQNQSDNHQKMEQMIQLVSINSIFNCIMSQDIPYIQKRQEIQEMIGDSQIQQHLPENPEDWKTIDHLCRGLSSIVLQLLISYKNDLQVNIEILKRKSKKIKKKKQKVKSEEKQTNAKNNQHSKDDQDEQENINESYIL